MTDLPHQPPFTFAQLRYFLAVAQDGHIGRAAERLHMSQPPLSRQIKALETALGVSLFLRTAHGVELTPAGVFFQQQAHEILFGAERAAQNVQAAAKGLRGHLRLGFTMYAAYGALPAVVRRLSTAAPDIEISLTEIMPEQIANQLKERRLDAAITFPGGGGEGCLSRTLLHDPLVAALPSTHPLALQTDPAPLDAYCDEPFLICPRQQAPVLFDSIVQYCQSAGFAPRLRFQALLQQTLISLVAEGLGIAFIPASVSRAQLAGVTYRPLPDPPLIEQVLVWRADAPGATLPVLLAEIDKMLASP